MAWKDNMEKVVYYYTLLPPPAQTTTDRNSCFLRSRAWLNYEIIVGGRWCCTHIFGPWCSPAMQCLFDDANRLTVTTILRIMEKRRAQ